LSSLEPTGEMNWDAGELPPWRLIPAALSAGALTPSDIVRHGVQVDQVGRSHAVYRVSVGGVPRFFVKSFGRSRGATDGLASREAAVLQLARERPAVAALVPDPWPWADDPLGAAPYRVVATAAVQGAEAWTFDRAGGGDQPVDEAWRALIAALIPPLAAFHRATRDLARSSSAVPAGLEPIEPWGLCLMDGDAPPELWATPATSALLHEAAADATLVAGLRAARGLWRPIALVHADLKHDNVLIEHHGARPRVRVLDWEMARVGDPAWDLATMTARLAVARGDAAPWSEADLEAAALLLGGYSAASRLPVPALAHRLVRYAATVLLMMALQHGSMLAPGADTSQARQLIMRARSTFIRAEGLTAAIANGAETIRA
jgi:Phosphotransferase enzyme family